MILATPLNHHIVTLCNLLTPVSSSFSWRQDCLCWLAVAGTFVAARQGDDVQKAYPVTTRKMIEVIGADLFQQITQNPSHPVLFENREKRLVAEKVFGELVLQANEVALSSEAEWHESKLIGDQVRDILGAMYYAVRFIATHPNITFAQGMQAAVDYTS